jgi:hypothetical protein
MTACSTAAPPRPTARSQGPQGPQRPQRAAHCPPSTAHGVAASEALLVARARRCDGRPATAITARRRDRNARDRRPRRPRQEPLGRPRRWSAHVSSSETASALSPLWARRAPWGASPVARRRAFWTSRRTGPSCVLGLVPEPPLVPCGVI